MTATYDRQGIQFKYPENWELVDDDLDALPRTISVQSPSGAFWSVDIHPYSMPPDELLERVLEAMQAEYEGLESSPASSQIHGENAAGYDMYFLCLDFVVASQIRCFRRGHATYLLTTQAEDRDFDKFSPVFAAISHSFFDGELS